MNLSDTTKIICPGASALLVYTTKKKNRKKRTLLKTPAMKTKESNMVKKILRVRGRTAAPLKNLSESKYFVLAGKKHPH